MVLQKNSCFSIAALLAILFCIAYHYAVPLVGEEARYASVAWQMFSEKHWIVPKYGDQLYLEKMPLLFWCLELGWWMTTAWPWQTIIPIIFALLTIFYTQKLTCAFFPDKPVMISLVPLVLVCMPFFLDNLGLLRFDMLLTFLNVLACYSVIRAKNSRCYYWFFIFINCLGVLTKGPVFYIFTLVESLLFCIYFSNHPIRDIFKWWCAVALSVLCMLIYLFFVIGLQHQDDFYHLFSRQIVSRALAQHREGKPFWDYVVLLPCFFLPWMVFWPLWRVKALLTESEKNKKTLRFFSYMFIMCFIIFSLIKTKEARYILPLTPFVAIMISYYLEKVFFINKRKAIKQIVLLLTVSFLLTTFSELLVARITAKTRNLMPMAQFVKQLLATNTPVVSESAIALDMQFPGRWSGPVTIFWHDATQLQQWINNHPNGWLITTQLASITVKQSYAVMHDGCFEQTYDHLKRIIRVCPILRDVS